MEKLALNFPLLSILLNSGAILNWRWEISAEKYWNPIGEILHHTLQDDASWLQKI